ncbi:hypothetical protein [Aliarcobacter cryaerophilus]|uniref:hypothetical protein n=1 Tax=Aliarcobacter cryaerophilus TaxID=28198 RepID=UPI003AF3CDC4
MLSYNHYKLIEDLNKKLLLYKNTYVEEKEYFFNDSKMYDISLQLKNNSKSNISFSYEDIIPISSELWKLLLKSNESHKQAFNNWFEIIKKSFKYLDIIKLQFEDDNSKNIFLDEALKYILNSKELIQTWEDNYKQLLKESRKYDSFLQDLDISIPEELKQLEKNKTLLNAFYWWNYRDNSNMLFMNSFSLYGNLIFFIIKHDKFLENQEKSFFRTTKLLNNCLERPYLAGILLSKTFFHHELISFYLSKKETLPIGVSFIMENNNLPNIQTNTTDYMIQWREILFNQTLDICFLHFESENNLDKKETSNILSELIKLIIIEESHKQFSYLPKILNYIEKTQVKFQNNSQKSLLRVVLSEFVECIINIKFNSINRLELPYDKINLLLWLLSKVYEESFEIDTNHNIEELQLKIIDEIINLYKNTILKSMDFIGLRVNKRIFDIDWTIFLKLATKEQKKNILDIGKIFKIQDLKKDEKYYNRLNTIRVHVSFLLSLNQNSTNQDKDNIEKSIILIIKKFVNKKYYYKDIFQSFLEKDNYRLFDTLVQSVNFFNTTNKLNFYENILDKISFSNILQIYTNSTSSEIKKLVLDKLNKYIVSIDDFELIPEMIETIAISINNNELKEFTIPLLDILEKNQKGGYFSNIYNELKYKKEILDIFHQKITMESKIEKINKVKIPIDTNKSIIQYGVNKSQINIYRDFIISLLYIENNPEQTYKILKELLDRDKQPIYVINLLNTRYRIIEKESIEDNNILVEKYKLAIKEWEEYKELIPNYKLDKYDYLLILEGYQIINDKDKFLIYWNEMPKYFQYDLDIVPIRCKYLKKQDLVNQAIEYLNEIFELNPDIDLNIKEELLTLKKSLNEYVEIKYIKKINTNVAQTYQPLSKGDIKEFWLLKIKSLPDEQHAYIFSSENNINLKDFILDINKQIAFELLERKINLKKASANGLEIENIINDWVASLFKQKMNYLGWQIYNQSRGGSSATGKDAGERDIIVKNQYGGILFLLEAFRLSSNNKNTISQHMDKIDGYNATGCPVLIIFVYCNTNEFVSLCDNYKDYLETKNYAGFDQSNLPIKSKFNEIELKESNIIIFSEVRKKNKKNIDIFHVLCDFS